MPQIFESLSKFSTVNNSAPDLILIEQSFLKDGFAMSVDNDLRVELLNLGDSDVLQEITFFSSPKIEKKVTATGVYYFIKINPVNFAGLSVLQSKWYAKIQGVPYEKYPLVSIAGHTDTNERILLASEIRDWILNKFGYPKISVELTESQIGTCIDDALGIFNRFSPKMMYGSLQIAPGVKSYTIPPPGRGIIDVQFTRKEGNPLFADPFFGREFPRYSYLDFDNYVLSSSFYETLLKKTGQDPIWRWEPMAPTKLYIDLGGTNRSFYHCTYTYVTDRRLEEISTSHQELFKKLALAHAKLILGNVRRKFDDSIAAPNGQLKLDGSALIAEGKEEIEKISEDVRNLAIPTPPSMY